MNRGGEFIILCIAVFMLNVGSVFAEQMIEGVKVPKFPAPPQLKNYEPPDWRDYPWHPAGKSNEFDINQPYAAEKLAWIAKDAWDSGYVLEQFAILVDRNRFGHIRVMPSGRITLHYYGIDFKDLLSYHEGKVNEGDVEFKEMIFFHGPPQLRGSASLNWDYVESPAKTREVDRWVYVSALRRVRRLAAGADDDKIFGTDWTVDDLGEREVWEEEHVLLGSDYIGPEDHSYPEYKPKGMFQEDYRPIFTGKPMKCWVVLSVSRKPKYYLSKRIVWYDVNTLLPVREEHYDPNGNLWKIFDWCWQDDTQKVGSKTVRYWSRPYIVIWDIKINHTTWLCQTNTYDENTFLPWKGKGSPPDSFFDVKRLERESWGRPLPKNFPKLGEEVIPRLKLLKDRFKPYRNIILPEEMRKKLIEEYGE